MHQEQVINNGSKHDNLVIIKKINSVMETDLINEQEEYLSNHYGIKPNYKMEKIAILHS